jgi:hypothetical protein
MCVANRLPSAPNLKREISFRKFSFLSWRSVANLDVSDAFVGSIDNLMCDSRPGLKPDAVPGQQLIFGVAENHGSRTFKYVYKFVLN